ncbi:acyltransferase family protein [Flagellimonas sp. S174]|uniref:acyltransferase family protein n=1 Tax=Flagellimonas sp. S174 TaxID=3410790 RepID=UPI00261C1E95|nr:acyltransferase [uncultured Allomuricauda sp.]
MKNTILGKPFSLEFFRRKSSQRYIPEIDALRFLAIVPVLLAHLSQSFLEYNVFFDAELIKEESALRAFFRQGNFGVHLFFAISGFILTLPFIDENIKKLSFKNYYLRRLVRIEPPYIIAITMFFVVHIFLAQKDIQFLFERYLGSLLYSHNQIFETRSYILPVAWSLEIEIQFYLLMPLILLILKLVQSKYWRYLIYIGLYLFSFHVEVTSNGDLNNFMMYFLAGILAADIYKNNKFSPHFVWDVTFVVSLVLFFSIDSDLTRSIFLFFVVISSLNLVLLKKIMTAPLITVIGGMCYTLYLLHYPLYHLFMKTFTNHLTFFESYEATVLFQILIFLPISIILMSAYFLLVEKPFMALSQRIGKKRKQNVKA